MSIRRMIAFVCGIGVVAFALVGLLNTFDASPTVVGLSLALFAVATGTASTLLEGRPRQETKQN